MSLGPSAGGSDPALLDALPGPDTDDPGAVRTRARRAASRIVASWRRDAPERAGLCLVAMGGLARGELAPGSDLDLMVFHDPLSEAEREALLAFTRGLWSELGREIHAVLRDKDAVRRCLETDLAGATALLEARLLAGDAEAFARLRAVIREEFLPTHGARFLDAKIDEAEERHAPADALLSVNEPELKRGRGGQRDHQLLTLILALDGPLGRGEPLPEAEPVERVLAGLGRDDPAMRERVAAMGGDEADVERSLALLDATRAATHELSGDDRLLKIHQATIARSFGYEDRADRSAAEVFMTDLHHARRGVYRRLQRCLQDRDGGRATYAGGVRRVSSGLVARGDALESAPGAELDTPEAVLKIFVLGQQSKRLPSPALMRRLRDEVVPGLGDEAFQTPLAYGLLREILLGTTFVAATLRAMHEAGLLGALLPEFAALDGLAQFDAVHAWTVDEHTLNGLAALEGLGVDRERRESAIRQELFHRVPHRDLLRLGLLMHDIGKVGGMAGHVERGVALLPAACLRMGLDAFSATHVDFLTRHHLTLSQLSRTRRILDEGTTATLLEACGRNRLRLEHLYLLTCADMAAVSPTSFTHWQDVLVTRLFETACDLVEGAPPPTGSPELRELLLAGVPEDQRGQLRRHLELCPDGYLTEVDPDQALDDLALAGELGVHNLSLHVQPDGPVLRLAFATRHWTNSFVHLTGALGALAFSIHDATIWSRRDGVSLTRFVVRDLRDRPPEMLRGQILELLDRTRRGEIDLADRVRETSRAFPRVLPTPATGGTRVELHNEASPNQTLVEVTARDRLGLLYVLVRALARENLVIHFAKISTEGGEALDTFYVSRDGAKVSDPREQQRLQAALQRALGEPGEF